MAPGRELPGVKTIRDRLLLTHLLVALIPLLGLWFLLARGWTARGADAGFEPGLLVLALGAAVLLALMLALRAASMIAAPIERIGRSVGRVADGDLSQRVPTVGLGELADLAGSFNAMTARLEESILRIASDRSQFQTILTRMAEGIVVTDTAGIIRLFNPAAERLLGRPAEEALGKPLLEATLNHQLADLLAETLQGDGAHTREVRLLEPARTVLSVYAAPIQVQTSDHPLSSSPHPLITPSSPTGAVLVLRDLTETRRLEEMRRDFVANVSHELKTPIAAIQALAETIQIHGAQHPELVTEYSERIVAETTRLGRLVQDLLDLAEIEGGRREVRRSIIHARRLVDETAARLADAAQAKGIDLRPEGEEFIFRGDRDAIIQALFNLIDNAIRYTPAGGRVTVGCRAEGNGIEFWVEDTGVGIPPEAQSRVFERFYRVDKARSRELGGTGLGLSIVKHIAEANGGRVGLESEVGRGSRFTLWLPRRPVEPDALLEE